MMSYGSKQWRPWILDEAEAEPIVRRAVEQGIIFFDTADVYSLGMSEEITGRLLARFFARRDDYVLATKANSPMGRGPNDRGLSRKHLIAAVDASLWRLDTDYIDLFQIHRWDNETPIAETLETLDGLVRAGKIRYLGASSMFAWQFAKALFLADHRGWTRFISMQNHYNLVYREEEREMIPLCQDSSVGILPWSPLARGLLAGSRTQAGEQGTLRARNDSFAGQLYDDSDADFAVVRALDEVAGQRAVPPARIALAWLLQRPGVTAPIVGATKPVHIDDAVAALDIALSAAEVDALEAPYRPHAVRGHG
jgi:aryl-alcohol dehydrogenase-like predicted oxidoreductase